MTTWGRHLRIKKKNSSQEFRNRMQNFFLLFFCRVLKLTTSCVLLYRVTCQAPTLIYNWKMSTDMESSKCRVTIFLLCLSGISY